MSGIFDPGIRRHLLREEGEVIVDEVRHHGIVYAQPIAELVLAFLEQKTR